MIINLLKKLLFLTIISVLVLPFPLVDAYKNDKKIKGYINYVSKIYWCTDRFSCLHEKAHLIDKENGFLSETDEYKIALLVYLITDINHNGINNKRQEILVNMIQEPREVYADVYAIYNGNIPDDLQSFYPDLTVKQTRFRFMDKTVFVPVGY